ncbi:hypothetical protein [Francisella-like endosymbiont]
MSHLNLLVISKIKDNLYDIHVFPKKAKDKIIYATRKDYIICKKKT